VHRKFTDDEEECKYSNTESIAALSDSSYDSELAAILTLTWMHLLTLTAPTLNMSLIMK